MRRALALLLALLCLPLAARADECTHSCAYTGSKSSRNVLQVRNGLYGRGWSSGVDAPWLRVDAPEGDTIAALYVCFDRLPDKLAVQAPDGDGWRTVLEPAPQYLHTLIELPQPLASVRLASEGTLSIANMRVFSPGALPGDVQRWQDPPEKVDLLVLSAHPDDELLFFGGVIPYYAAVKGKAVLVAYMTGANNERRHELLDGLWTAGERYYPVIGDFDDQYFHTLQQAYRRWDRNEVNNYLVKLVRRYKPEVVVTHDINGEYGHGAHKLCADAMIRLLDRFDDPLYFPQHAVRYGTWSPPRLYLHLYKQNPVAFDWRQTYEALGGASPLEVARKAFEKHISQFQMGIYAVRDDYEYTCAEFGLYNAVEGAPAPADGFFDN